MEYTNKKSELDDNSLSNEEKYLVINVADEYFGFGLSKICEILRLPEVTIVPDSPEYVRGLITLREQVIPLIDIRLKLKFKTIEEESNELISLLEQREQDHINWLNALIESVKNRTEFKLTTDPHKCKFGMWYDKYHTKRLEVKEHLEKFDQPHKQIHAIAVKVSEIIKNEDYDKALLFC